MLQNIEELVLLLKESGCNPEMVNIDRNTGFSRTIKFYMGEMACYIKWYCNESTLSIGGEFASYIPFTVMTLNDTWPSYATGFKFWHDGNAVAYLTLKYLDWQCEKLGKGEE